MTDEKYSGGAISGYILAEHQLEALDGGYYYHDINQVLNFYSTPRDGTYYVTLCVLDDKNGLSVKDYIKCSFHCTLMKFQNKLKSGMSENPEVVGILWELHLILLFFVLIRITTPQTYRY